MVIGIATMHTKLCKPHDPCHLHKSFLLNDKKEIGLNNVAKIDTEVTHHGIVPSPLKNSFPCISFFEKCNPANRTAAR